MKTEFKLSILYTVAEFAVGNYKNLVILDIIQKVCYNTQIPPDFEYTYYMYTTYAVK